MDIYKLLYWFCTVFDMVLYDLYRTNAPLCLKKTSALFINYKKENVNTNMTLIKDVFFI